MLIRHDRDIYAFSDEAIRFYLPAYLLAALDEAGDIIYWLVHRLEPWEPEYLEKWKRKLQRYTPAQKRAIRLFLEYVRDAMPHVSLGDLAQRALDVYWGQEAP